VRGFPALDRRILGYDVEVRRVTKDGDIVTVTEHVAPSLGACCFWLKNRRPSEWRDVQHIDQAVGHYIISDKPMSEEQWIEERTKIAPPVTRAMLPSAS
jgi:hypothetical protein